MEQLLMAGERMDNLCGLNYVENYIKFQKQFILTADIVVVMEQRQEQDIVVIKTKRDTDVNLA